MSPWLLALAALLTGFWSLLRLFRCRVCRIPVNPIGAFFRILTLTATCSRCGDPEP